MAKLSDKYTYRVTWSEDDNEFVALYNEFHGLNWPADTPEKALKGTRKLLADVLLDMNKKGEPVPEPISSKHFSGKFMVRVPPEVHRKLAIQAAEAV